jgi:hypothetical protein
MVVTALLEPDEVVGADAGEQRKLLTPKALDTPAAKARESDVLWRYPVAPGAQELAEVLGAVHHSARYSCLQHRG